MQMLAVGAALVWRAWNVSWNAAATSSPTAPAFRPGSALYMQRNQDLQSVEDSSDGPVWGLCKVGSGADQQRIERALRDAPILLRFTMLAAAQSGRGSSEGL